MSADDLAKKLETIAKLLAIQVRPRIEDLKLELVKTPQQKRVYEALDGTKTVRDLARIAGYSHPRPLETMLPRWEQKGLILSSGKGSLKRYINIDNLEG